jgi:hypothetical protein
MIKIVPLDGTPVQYFESFDEFFKDLTATKNLKLVDDHPYLSQLNWSFTIYPPKRVAALYAHTKDPCEPMQEAFEDHLPLIQICTGDYKKPLYIVLTPNVNLDYLKRKWCVDWCTFHHLLVKELD